MSFVPNYELLVAATGTSFGLTEDAYQETLLRFRAATMLVSRPELTGYGPCSQAGFTHLMQSSLGPLCPFAELDEDEFDQIIQAQFGGAKECAMPWIDGSAYVPTA